VVLLLLLRFLLGCVPLLLQSIHVLWARCSPDRPCGPNRSPLASRRDSRPDVANGLQPGQQNSKRKLLALSSVNFLQKS
jgi:hypothetical protein